jgi:hypothetical protein
VNRREVIAGLVGGPILVASGAKSQTTARVWRIGSQLPQVARALSVAGTAEAAKTGSELTDDVSGHPVLTADARIGRVGWLVFVQSPISEALAPVYGALVSGITDDQLGQRPTSPKSDGRCWRASRVPAVAMATSKQQHVARGGRSATT